MSEEKITQEEMALMFGEFMPIEAVQLLCSVPDDWTIGQVRAELRRMAEERNKKDKAND